MKHKIWLLMVGLLALTMVTGCQKKDDTINCTVYWQLYQREKYATPESIEKVFHDTFTDYWPNSPTYNSVRVYNTTQHDVKSLTLKLAQLADKKITEEVDPDLGYDIEVKVLINFNGSYVDEVWSKLYQ